MAFSGSMNESATAMLVNYETIDVFRSWGDQSEQERVMLKQKLTFITKMQALVQIPSMMMVKVFM